MKSLLLKFETNHALISKDDWDDLNSSGTDIAIAGIKAAITQVIQKGGCFMILRDDGGIHRRIDRMSELNELLNGD